MPDVGFGGSRIEQAPHPVRAAVVPHVAVDRVAVNASGGVVRVEEEVFAVPLVHQQMDQRPVVVVHQFPAIGFQVRQAGEKTVEPRFPVGDRLAAAAFVVPPGGGDHPPIVFRGPDGQHGVEDPTAARGDPGVRGVQHSGAERKRGREVQRRRHADLALVVGGDEHAVLPALFRVTALFVVAESPVRLTVDSAEKFILQRNEPGFVRSIFHRDPHDRGAFVFHRDEIAGDPQSRQRAPAGETLRAPAVVPGAHPHGVEAHRHAEVRTVIRHRVQPPDLRHLVQPAVKRQPAVDHPAILRRHDRLPAGHRKPFPSVHFRVSFRISLFLPSDGAGRNPRDTPEPETLISGASAGTIAVTTAASVSSPM